MQFYGATLESKNESFSAKVRPQFLYSSLFVPNVFHRHRCINCRESDFWTLEACPTMWLSFLCLSTQHMPKVVKSKLTYTILPLTNIIWIVPWQKSVIPVTMPVKRVSELRCLSVIFKVQQERMFTIYYLIRRSFKFYSVRFGFNISFRFPNQFQLLY
jgi:hypothetical protein